MTADYRGPGGQWPKFLRHYHGMRPEDWHMMFDAQDGKCYLCERSLPSSRTKIHIDHDHRCPRCKRGPGGQSFTCRWCRRGLACMNCNTAIALADDDPQRLWLIAANLERAQKAARELLLTIPEQGDLLQQERRAQ